MARAIQPLDPAPQVDFLGRRLLNLLGEIHRGNQTGRWIIDILALDGDLSKTTIANPQRVNMPAEMCSRKKS